VVSVTITSAGSGFVQSGSRAEVENTPAATVARGTNPASVCPEIGTDLSRFSTPSHLASWAGLGPGNNESAGKRKSGRTGNGDVWLRAAPTEAAQAASRTKNTYLASQYHHLAARRGKKKAIVAVAHSILRIMWHLLTTIASTWTSALATLRVYIG
jgi:Transposase IS116/IS110/IS902 family